jgi:hypothetical protein
VGSCGGGFALLAADDYEGYVKGLGISLACMLLAAIVVVAVVAVAAVLL